MNDSLKNLYFSGKFKDVSAAATAIYTLLRLDAESGRSYRTKTAWNTTEQLVSGLSAQGISDTLGLNLVSVNFALDELVSLEWIQTIEFESEVTYLIGVVQDKQLVFLSDTALRRNLDARRIAFDLREQSESNKKKRAALEKEQAERAASQKGVAQAQRSLEEITQREEDRNADPNASAAFLARHFGDRYSILFGQEYPGVNSVTCKGRTYAMDPRLKTPFLNLREWAGSIDNGVEFLDFALENWGELKDAFGFDKGTPSPFLFTHPGFFQRVRDAMVNGIPAKGGVSNRSTRTDWDNETSGW